MLFEEEAAIIAGSFAACLLLTLFLGAYLAELLPACGCCCTCGCDWHCDEDLFVEWFCLRFCPLRGSDVRRALSDDIERVKAADLHGLIDRSNALCAAAKEESATREAKSEANLALKAALDAIEQLPKKERAGWLNFLKP